MCSVAHGAPLSLDAQMWVRDEAVLSKENEKEFNESVLLAIILKFTLFAAMIVIGGILVIVSIVLGAHAYKQYRRSKTDTGLDYSSETEPINIAVSSAYGSRSSVASQGERY